MHPLIRACKGPDISLELAYARKIDNFDNVEFFFSKHFLTHSNLLESLIGKESGLRLNKSITF